MRPNTDRTDLKRLFNRFLHTRKPLVPFLKVLLLYLKKIFLRSTPLVIRYKLYTWIHIIELYLGAAENIEISKIEHSNAYTYDIYRYYTHILNAQTNV